MYFLKKLQIMENAPRTTGISWYYKNADTLEQMSPYPTCHYTASLIPGHPPVIYSYQSWIAASNATSTISLKVDWRSSADVSSPVKMWSEMVNTDKAWRPNLAASV